MVKKLQHKFISLQLTLSTAESCTGGHIAHQITRVSGSSEYFLGSVISYSNTVKENILGVSPSDIEKFGAVSEPVAIQMASGVRKLMDTDFAISTTGLAGPTGGTEEKPVGTVWIGLNSIKKSFAKRFQFYGSRESIIHQTTEKALEMLFHEVSNR